jgi:hypothetical protein
MGVLVGVDVGVGAEAVQAVRKIALASNSTFITRPLSIAPSMIICTKRAIQSDILVFSS